MLTMGREMGLVARGAGLARRLREALRRVYLGLMSEPKLDILACLYCKHSLLGKRQCIDREGQGDPFLENRGLDWRKNQAARRQGWMKTLPLIHSCAIGQGSHPLWASVFFMRNTGDFARV